MEASLPRKGGSCSKTSHFFAEYASLYKITCRSRASLNRYRDPENVNFFGFRPEWRDCTLLRPLVALVAEHGSDANTVMGSDGLATPPRTVFQDADGSEDDRIRLGNGDGVHQIPESSQAAHFFDDPQKFVEPGEPTHRLD